MELWRGFCNAQFRIDWHRAEAEAEVGLTLTLTFSTALRKRKSIPLQGATKRRADKKTIADTNTMTATEQ